MGKKSLALGVCVLMLLLVIFSSGCIEEEGKGGAKDGTLQIKVENTGYDDEWVTFYVDDTQVDRKYVRVGETKTWVGYHYEFGTYKLSVCSEISDQKGDEYVTISEKNVWGKAGWTFGSSSITITFYLKNYYSESVYFDFAIQVTEGGYQALVDEEIFVSSQSQKSISRTVSTAYDEYLLVSSAYDDPYTYEDIDTATEITTYLKSSYTIALSSSGTMTIS